MFSLYESISGSEIDGSSGASFLLDISKLLYKICVPVCAAFHRIYDYLLCQIWSPLVFSDFKKCCQSDELETSLRF